MKSQTASSKNEDLAKTGEKMSQLKYQEFLKQYGANSERLHRIGIHSFGYGPGHLAKVKDVPIDLPQILVDIICELIKQVQPETQNDKKMINAYKKRTKAKEKK